MEQVKVITTPAKMVPIDSLVPHPNNPRQGDVGAIVQSIRANGFYGIVVAQKETNVIIVGEHRWRAAKEAGMDKVPASFADVDDAAARRIMLADNRTSDLASYDDSLLVELLQVTASESSLDGTGYDGDDLDAMIAGMEPPPAKEKKERQETFYRCPKCGHSWTGKPTGGETVE